MTLSRPSSVDTVLRWFTAYRSLFFITVLSIRADPQKHIHPWTDAHSIGVFSAMQSKPKRKKTVYFHGSKPTKEDCNVSLRTVSSPFWKPNEKKSACTRLITPPLQESLLWFDHPQHLALPIFSSLGMLLHRLSPVRRQCDYRTHRKNIYDLALLLRLHRRSEASGQPNRHGTTAQQ